MLTAQELAETPKHIGLILDGKLSTEEDFAFYAEGLRRYMRLVANAWGVPVPGVAYYTPATFIPASEGAAIIGVDDDGHDDTAGFHTALGNMPYGLVDLRQSSNVCRTAAHEFAELALNPFLDRWRKDAHGTEHALELCDAVQRDEFAFDVELFGRQRSVSMSNFLLPAWFTPGAPGPYDYLGRLTRPFEIGMGGYGIVRRDGIVDYIASTMDAHRLAADKVARLKHSRTRRIVTGSPAL